jgi:hypothetical protein
MPTTWVTWINWFDQRQYTPPIGENLLFNNKMDGDIQMARWDGNAWDMGWGSYYHTNQALWAYPTMPVKISGPFSLDFLRDQ